MNRNEFIIATAIILFAAFILGWFASWLIHRLSRVTRADMGELESMAQQLHDAEEARDKAVTELEEREADLVAKLGTAESNCARRRINWPKARPRSRNCGYTSTAS